MLREGLVGLFLVSIVLGMAPMPAVTALAPDYGLTISESIETPSREITIEGETHTVSAVARTAPGTQLPVTVRAPTDASYQVLLYDGDRHIADSKNANGDATVEFDLTDYAPGSYLVALYKDGQYQDVYPVVVRGYTVTVDAPSRAETTSVIEVTATLENTANTESPHAVEVVLATSDQTVRTTATEQSEQTYHAAVSLDEVPTGEARLYAVVRGSDSAFIDGQNELLGMSDATAVSIYQRSTPTTTQTTAQAPTHSPTTTSAPSANTETPTETPTTTSTTALTTTTASSIQNETQTSNETEPTTEPTRTTASNVITPAQSPPTTSTPDTESGTPGFAFLTSVFSLIGSLALLARRQD